MPKFDAMYSAVKAAMKLVDLTEPVNAWEHSPQGIAQRPLQIQDLQSGNAAHQRRVAFGRSLLVARAGHDPGADSREG